MWDHMARYVEKSNAYVGLLLDTKWFRGWEGLPEGCTLKPVTAAAYSCCFKIDDVKYRRQIVVYLDGSPITQEARTSYELGVLLFQNR